MDEKKLMCTFRVKAPFSNSLGVDWMEPELNNNLTRFSMVIKLIFRPRNDVFTELNKVRGEGCLFLFPFCSGGQKFNQDLLKYCLDYF